MTNDEPQQELRRLKDYLNALSDKIASFERHMDPRHEDDIYDAVRDARADAVLNNPVMNLNRVFYSPGLDHEPLAPSIKALNEAAEYMRKTPAPTRDWEVVEFRDIVGTGSYHLDGNERYDGTYTLHDMLHLNLCVDSGDVIIHSVRRLSDGQVFSVGDVTEDGIIIGFNIAPGKLTVLIQDEKQLGCIRKRG